MLPFWWLWENMKGVHKRYILALCISFIPPLISVVNPSIVSYIVDHFVAVDGAATTAYPAREVLPWLIAMVLVHTIRMACFYLAIILTEQASQTMVVNIRRRLFDNILEQEMRFFQRYRTGDLMTRFTGDLDLCRHCVAYIARNMINHVLMFIVAFSYLMTVNWQMTLIVVAVMPLIAVIRTVFSRRARPLFINLRERLSDLNAAAQENIEGNRVVRAFAREDYEIGRFAKKNNEYREINLAVNRAWYRVWPFLEGISQSLTITIALVGGLFAINKMLTVGQLASFITLSWAIADPMRMFGVLFNDIERFLTSSAKVIELYYEKPTVTTRPEAVAPSEEIRGDIEFRNVNFSYGKTTVLKDINLKIKAGETVAIMGETGSGKTTLLNLIPRFYDIQGGSVLLDGLDVRDYPIPDLRKGIGIATQDVFLFSDTVDGNVAYGNPDLPFEDVQRYAKMVDADSFVQRMPEGYDTVIGERGVGLSGGQRQRIALARAMAISPRVLILDDTTSAVDMETELYIQEQLRQIPYACTKIIVAQRISSVKAADKIVILANNTIAQMGTHEELLAQEGYYREIYRMQTDAAADKEVG